jgi:cell division protein ZipA
MLRIILLIIGILIILGIAFDGWRRKRKRLKKTQSINQISHKSVDVDDKAEISDDDFFDPVVEMSAMPVNEQFSEPRLVKPESTELNAAEISEENILYLKEKFTASPKQSAPTPIEIEPVRTTEASANQSIPEKPAIKSQTIQSANQSMPKKAGEPPKAPQPTPEILTLTVMSLNARPFAGYDVIRALQECNLHHGEFDIYHRHKYRNGKGPLYFSIASVVKPGTINPRKVGELSTPGLALFMTLDNPKHDRTVFKQALATAHHLAKALGGVVCDNNRVPLREGTLQAYAEKLKL